MTLENGFMVEVWTFPTLKNLWHHIDYGCRDALQVFVRNKSSNECLMIMGFDKDFCLRNLPKSLVAQPFRGNGKWIPLSKLFKPGAVFWSQSEPVQLKWDLAEEPDVEKVKRLLVGFYTGFGGKLNRVTFQDGKNPKCILKLTREFTEQLDVQEAFLGILDHKEWSLS